MGIPMVPAGQVPVLPQHSTARIPTVSPSQVPVLPQHTTARIPTVPAGQEPVLPQHSAAGHAVPVRVPAQGGLGEDSGR